ncbi:unnamed protein product [Linum trigynum]|uniref:Uncharacterized protein n=1 Tax=Linum trigynum TaxID=586398 RepID=A0AAV2GB57_9ROSI
MRGVADLEDNIQFQLGGEHHQLSIREFTRAMDIYSADFVDSPDAFAKLTREFDFPCFKSFYESEVNRSDSRPWDVKLSKASEVKPEWRLKVCNYLDDFISVWLSCLSSSVMNRTIDSPPFMEEFLSLV